MNPLAPQPTAESRNITVLVYILTIFFSFIPGLVIFVLKKDDAFIYDAGKEVLNWSITLALAFLVLPWIPLLGWIACGVLWLMNVVCCIFGALNANKGLSYRFPFALRLIA